MQQDLALLFPAISVRSVVALHPRAEASELTSCATFLQELALGDVLRHAREPDRLSCFVVDRQRTRLYRADTAVWEHTSHFVIEGLMPGNGLGFPAL